MLLELVFRIIALSYLRNSRSIYLKYFPSAISPIIPTQEPDIRKTLCYLKGFWNCYFSTSFLFDIEQSLYVCAKGPSYRFHQNCGYSFLYILVSSFSGRLNPCFPFFPIPYVILLGLYLIFLQFLLSNSDLINSNKINVSTGRL